MFQLMVSSLNYLRSLVMCHRVQYWSHSYLLCISMILLTLLMSLQLVNFSLMTSNYIATLNSLMILPLVIISIIIWHLPYWNLNCGLRVWQLRVNVSKCSVLHLGLHNLLFTYTLNAKPLSKADCVRDLGVTYDNKLRFDDYIFTKLYPKLFKWLT